MDLDSEDSSATCSGSEMRKINWSLHFSSLGPTLCSLPPGFQPCPPRVPSLSISLLAIFEVGVGRCALLWGCRAAQVFCQFKLGGPRSRTISPTPAVYQLWGYSRGHPPCHCPFGATVSQGRQTFIRQWHKQNLVLGLHSSMELLLDSLNAYFRGFNLGKLGKIFLT